MRRSVLSSATPLLVLVLGCTDRSTPELGQARLSLAETLSGADTVGYERAREPRAFQFPQDHGPHEGFRTEWWYVTGNLESQSGREFGFQFTIFRSSLAPSTPDRTSPWATNQAYMGHFALTDITRGTFAAHERFARGAVGLAGARSTPLRVWLEDWVLEGSATAAEFPMHLRVAEGDIALELSLTEGKPAVLQGEGGLSQKGPEPGNASYYYSHSRLPASGTLQVGGETLDVSGLAWLDREWSTSALSEGQVGWDWFSLQLDDGWDAMVYQLRREDGSADPLSDGVLIDPSGERVALDWSRDVELVPSGRWRSPIDGSEYPSGWRLRVPSRGWDLAIEPALEGQELDLAFRYWEGSVRITGRGEQGAEVAGRGYVELTGYAGDVPGR